MTTTVSGSDEAGVAPPASVVWRDLVTTALLGTDRRDPPEPAGSLGDLVADTARVAPAERMLALVGAATAVRRAAILPGPGHRPLTPPDGDPRRPCVPAAVDRWHHITTSWPVLEDEWTLTLVTNGWRLADELIPAVLRRHRSHPVRHARARAAAGPSADWLIDQVPELACTKRATVDAEAFAELPELPIPPDLAELLHAPGDITGSALATALENGDLAHAHRAVLVNLLARIPADALAPVTAALDAVDAHSTGAALASVLADLASTRTRALDELS